MSMMRAFDHTRTHTLSFHAIGFAIHPFSSIPCHATYKRGVKKAYTKIMHKFWQESKTSDSVLSDRDISVLVVIERVLIRIHPPDPPEFKLKSAIMGNSTRTSIFVPVDTKLLWRAH